MDFMENRDMLGTVQEQFSSDRTLTITKEGRRYTVALGEKTVEADCLNLNHAVAGLSNGSTLQFGGQCTARVTKVETAGDEYAYVEVKN